MNDKLVRVLAILSFLLLLAIAYKLFLNPTPCNCCPASSSNGDGTSGTVIKAGDTTQVTPGDTSKAPTPRKR